MKNPLPIIVSILVAIVSYGGVISFLAQSSVQAANTTVRMYVTPSTAGTTVGQTVSVQLRLYKSSSAKVDYADARVTFSTAHLEVVSIAKQGSHFSLSGGPSTAYSNTNGTLTVAGKGNVLPETADVLIATVNLRAKAAGSGGISFTASSGAGDMSNGGHLKNVLDTRVGGVINISNPIGSGSSTPSTPGSGSPAPAETPATPPETQTPGEQQMQTPEQSANNGTTTDTSNDGVASDIEAAVVKPPVWLQYLLPAAGIVGVLGLGGLGYTLYLKRREAGVTLPPAEEELSAMMPSTETLTTSQEASPEQKNVEEGPLTHYENPEADLPEFSAQRTLEYTAPLAGIAEQTPPDAVLTAPVAPAEEFSVVEAMQPEAVAQPPQTEQYPETLAQTVTDPAPVDVQPVAVPEPTEQPLAQPALPVVPQTTQIAPEAAVFSPEPLPEAPGQEQPLPVIPTPEPYPTEPLALPAQPTNPPFMPETPAPQPTGLTPEPLQEPTQPEPVAAAVPQAPEMPSTMPQPLVTGPRIAEEYADLPDMFDLGEQRLRDEGHGELKPVRP